MIILRFVIYAWSIWPCPLICRVVANNTSNFKCSLIPQTDIESPRITWLYQVEDCSATDNQYDCFCNSLNFLNMVVAIVLKYQSKLTSSLWMITGCAWISAHSDMAVAVNISKNMSIVLAFPLHSPSRTRSNPSGHVQSAISAIRTSVVPMLSNCKLLYTLK